MGTDLSVEYMKTFAAQTDNAVPASAVDLPFRSGCFDGVWSFGLLHHLPRDMAQKAVGEMLRVSKRGGYVVVFDGVLPHSAWTRPLSWAIRKADRGRCMRRQHELEALMPASDGWGHERLTYSYLGHEGIFFTHRNR